MKIPKKAEGGQAQLGISLDLSTRKYVKPTQCICEETERRTTVDAQSREIYLAMQAHFTALDDKVKVLDDKVKQLQDKVK